MRGRIWNWKSRNILFFLFNKSSRMVKSRCLVSLSTLGFSSFSFDLAEIRRFNFDLAEIHFIFLAHERDVFSKIRAATALTRSDTRTVRAPPDSRDEQEWGSVPQPSEAQAHLHHRQDVHWPWHPSHAWLRAPWAIFPGRDQRHVLPGRTTSGLWRHVGTPLWSTWVPKGPRQGFRGRGKLTVTCWPDHLCTLQCCPWSRKNGDRWWNSRVGRQCLLWVGGRMLLRSTRGLGVRSESGARRGSQVNRGRATGHHVWGETLPQPHQKFPETLLNDATYLPCLGW